MPTITRRAPDSNEGRLTAINSAKTKNDSIPLPSQFLTPQTKNRLNAIHPVYNGLMTALGTAGFNSTQATADKNEAQRLARTWTSHYYQALNNAIEREEYPPTVRQFFNIDVNSDAVPDLDSEDKVELWGDRVTSGETSMIAAGFAAMPYPSQPNVKIKVDDFKAKRVLQSTAADALDTAQEAVDTQNAEADGVILKVWNEVETFHSEESSESMRANAEQWGVKYVTLGEITQVTFSAVHITTNTPEQDVKYKIISTGKVYESHHTDTAVAETRVVGATVVEATKAGFATQQKTVTIVEGQALAVQFTLSPL